MQSSSSPSSSVLSRPDGAAYVDGGFSDSFRAAGSGVEQTFEVGSAPAGSGPLTIAVPVSGLTAATVNDAVDLLDGSGHVRASYSDLRATDANGSVLAASIQATPDGTGIDISIDDSTAVYPIKVDPIWEQVSEVSNSDGAAGDHFGYSVAVAGTLAIVGAPSHTVSGRSGQGAAYVFSLSGGSWSQTAELTSSDGAAGDSFGGSVALSGTTAMVGAINHTVSGHTNQGSAYVFSLSGGSWSQTAELTSSDGAAGDSFGDSVAVSGTTAVVGARSHTVSGHSGQGSAYVFSLSGGVWSQTAELTSSDGAASDDFGWSVGLSGTVAVAGAPNHTVSGHTNQGAAYVFTLSGGVWSQTAELTASDGVAGDHLGYSVPISGTMLVVGAPSHNSTQGAAYVFSLSGGVWSQTAELTASDGAAGDDFGYTASISGTIVLVGAFYHAVDGHTNQGAAYQFVLSAASWSQTGELTAADGITNDYFATSVAVSGTAVVVGAPGHTSSGHANQGAEYMYTTWPQTGEPTTSDGAAHDYAGWSMAISGSTAVVGAYNHAVSGHSAQGAAYVYTLSGSTWTQTAELTASDGAAGDEFGYAVAISGSTTVIGAPDHSVIGHADQGAAYVFELAGTTWSQAAELTAGDGAGGDYLGWSVGISGANVVVGAPMHTVGANTNEGAAYVFEQSGTSWSQSPDLVASDGASGDEFGYAVAVSGSTVAVGGPLHAVGGHSQQGAAYVFAGTGATWTQSGELIASDGAAGDVLGQSVAVSGTTVVAGAPMHSVNGNSHQGAAYLFGSSGSGWSQSAELVGSDGTAGDELGYSVAIAGATVAAGAPGHTVSGNAVQGAAYAFAPVGAAWPQSGELVSTDGSASDEFGFSVAVSGTNIAVGAPYHSVSGHAGQGAGYAFASGLVQPQGAAPNTDLWGGGSPSEPCLPCTGTPASASTSNGGGPVVDPANGDLSYTASDLTLPGAGLPLEFTRTYDAQRAQAQAYTSATASTLGYGWSYNLGVNVVCNTGCTTATVTEENGSVLQFVPNTSAPSPYAWCPAPATGSYCPTSPRVAATLTDGTGATPWTFTRNNGTAQQETFTFSIYGTLVEISDAQSGDTLTESAYTANPGQTACPTSSCVAWTSGPVTPRTGIRPKHRRPDHDRLRRQQQPRRDPRLQHLELHLDRQSSPDPLHRHRQLGIEPAAHVQLRLHLDQPECGLRLRPQLINSSRVLLVDRRHLSVVRASLLPN
jgi:hypothetical protein